MQILNGIDDTDNLESRGTGYCARQLANWLNDNDLAAPGGITRHQLLVDPRIPYTSHNSLACCEYLPAASAPGSDVGLCIARPEQVSAQVMDFGRRAKHDVLTAAEAEQIAVDLDIRLAGLTGTGCGMIGALAPGCKSSPRHRPAGAV